MSTTGQAAAMTLAEAIAYLKPDPSNNGTISLRGPKAREAVKAIEREIADLRAACRQPGCSEAGDDKAATLWRTTGTGSIPIGGGEGTREWFRPSDGSIRSFPDTFDPNAGQYRSTRLDGVRHVG